MKRNQRFKKILSVVLVCSLVVSLFAAFSIPAAAGYYGDYIYEVVSSSAKTCKITRYTGNFEANLTIPSKLDGYTVVTLGEEAIYSTSLTTVTIPSTVKRIEDYCFEENHKLKTVNMGSNVTYIGKRAFYDTAITSITLPDSVKTIDDEAFSFCDQLKTVKLPNSITSIGDGAFEYCEKLTSITIPEKVTAIADNLFNKCSALKTVKLHSRIKTIGNYAFDDCVALASIDLPAGLTALGKGAFSNCEKLTSITIPAKVRTIGEYTFYKTALKEVTIPAGVRTIERSAFSTCKNLQKVIIKTGTQTVDRYAFGWCDNLKYISVPKSVTSWQRDAIHDCDQVKVHGLSGSYIESFFSKSYNSPSKYTNHIFTKTVVKPTCADGYTIYTCECGFSYEGNPVAATIAKHTKVNTKAVTATKTRAGKTAGSTCKVCKIVFEEAKPVPKIGAVTLSNDKPVYTGKTKKPTVKVTDADGNTISSSYYTVKFPTKSVEVGQYTVKVTFKGNYSGTISKTYQITPKGTSITKITRISNGLKLELKKQTSKTTGYQIQYALKSNFSDAKTVTITKNTTLKKTISKLTNGKTYYLRIRSYKNVTVSGKTTKIGSAWTEAAKVIAAKSIGKIYKQTEKLPSIVRENYSGEGLSITYAANTCSYNRTEVAMRITKTYKGYYPYRVTFYHATSKNGTYKAINTEVYDSYNQIFRIYDEKLSPNKRYFYKVKVLYVPEDCKNATHFKNLSATEKIYDETIAVESYYTAMKPQRDKKTSGTTMKWSSAKGATGYLVHEHVVKKLGYNIFGGAVFGHWRIEQLAKGTGAKSKIKANASSLRSASLFYDVYPYVKRGDYYYCDGEPVAKKLNYQKTSKFNKHAS